MLPDGVSDVVLHFVQHCQFAVCICGEEDYVAQVMAIWNCLAAFPRSATEEDLLAAVIAVCLVARGFFAFATKWRPSPNTRGLSRRLHANAVLRLAQERYKDPNLTLGQLARELHLSQPHLSRVLAHETNRAFRSAFRTHLNGIRLLAAVLKLLSNPKGSIAGIATGVGYPDGKELDRQFDRWFRLSPREFRNLIARIPKACLQMKPR